MPSELSEFLSSNASAIFGLAGALCGGVLSFIASVMLKKRDFNLQMWSKLIERRIAAHENVISLAVEMWVMVGLGGTDEHVSYEGRPKCSCRKRSSKAGLYALPNLRWRARAG